VSHASRPAGVMVVTFGMMYVRADVPIGEVVHGFLVPSLPEAYVPTVNLVFYPQDFFFFFLCRGHS
jgi:hypothetical protein